VIGIHSHKGSQQQQRQSDLHRGSRLNQNTPYNISVGRIRRLRQATPYKYNVRLAGATGFQITQLLSVAAGGGSNATAVGGFALHVLHIGNGRRRPFVTDISDFPSETTPVGGFLAGGWMQDPFRLNRQHCRGVASTVVRVRSRQVRRRPERWVVNHSLRIQIGLVGTTSLGAKR
jgi:hypothetical protein